MVKTKNNRKSLIALVVMAFMLVASIVMAATGAWFTDKADDAAPDLTFGTLDIAVTAPNALTVANTITELTGPVMPGSEITGDFTVENSGNASAYLRYKFEVTGEGAEAVAFDLTQVPGYKNGYVYVTTALAGDSDTTISFSVTVDTAVDNDAQGLSFTVTLYVEAVQSANNGTGYADATWPTTIEVVDENA